MPSHPLGSAGRDGAPLAHTSGVSLIHLLSILPIRNMWIDPLRFFLPRSAVNKCLFLEQRSSDDTPLCSTRTGSGTGSHAAACQLGQFPEVLVRPRHGHDVLLQRAGEDARSDKQARGDGRAEDPCDPRHQELSWVDRDCSAWCLRLVVRTADSRFDNCL